jgi:outer membrane protein assembly factor BamB
MPVLHDGRVFFTTGRHYESSMGPGRMGCLDPTRRGDISSHLRTAEGEIVPNPNSGLIWEYLGPGDGSAPLRRMLSSAVVHAGLVLASDIEGRLHCVDARTGEGQWVHDLRSNAPTSPLIVGDRVYAATDSDFFIFRLARQKELIAERDIPASIEASPVFCNGTLYVMTRSELFAIGDPKKSPNRD